MTVHGIQPIDERIKSASQIETVWKKFVSFIEAHLSGGDHSSIKKHVSLLHGVGNHVIVNGYFELWKKHMLANCSCQMV